MHHACIALGSNLGPGRETLRAAWEQLGRCSGIEPLALARPYRSEPVGMVSEHLFTNSAGMLATSLAPEALLELLLELEVLFGRHRTAPAAATRVHEDRSLDLDLLCYDDLAIKTSRLILPHPHMHCRLFVLLPLAEIAPQLVPPNWALSVAQARDRLLRQGEERVPQRLSWL